MHLVREQIGAVASLRDVVVVQRLPKTRSGKILRKMMRSIADGEKFQVPSTIDDEAIIVIHPDSYQIDVTQPIYEFITISLPPRIVHEEGECNQEMIDSLNKYLSSKKEEPKDDDIDPRWSALKNLN